MTSYNRFFKHTKVRYDYGDMIQVRYHHSSGENYDTWVSGDEVLQRLKSEASEEEIRALRKLDLDRARRTLKKLPDDLRHSVVGSLRDRLFDEVEDFLGDSVISETISEALRGRDTSQLTDAFISERWRSFLQNDQFRAKVVELAWIQLEGSFPDEEDLDNQHDWL